MVCVKRLFRFSLIFSCAIGNMVLVSMGGFFGAIVALILGGFFGNYYYEKLEANQK